LLIACSWDLKCVAQFDNAVARLTVSPKLELAGESITTGAGFMSRAAAVWLETLNIYVPPAYTMAGNEFAAGKP
jgi:hypothetical protein